MSNADLDIANKLGLTGIKNQWRYASPVEMELELYDQIPALVAFVRHLCKVYDNEYVAQNINARENKFPGQVSSFFFQLYGSIEYQKINNKDISDNAKLVNKHMKCFMEWDTNGQPRKDYIQLGKREPINQHSNEKNP